METKNTPFVISQDGKLTITSSLDRETKDAYSLVVRITDRGTNPKSLTSVKTIQVQVLDVNDNDPKFTVSNQQCKILENSAPNTHVCFSRATDRDIGENARLSYTIAGGDNKFSVNDVSVFFLFGCVLSSIAIYGDV